MTAPVIPLTNAPDLVKSDRLDLATAGSVGAYTYTEVKGLKSLQENNSYTTQDTTVFDTGIRGTDMPTQFKKTLSGTLQKYVADNPTHVQLKASGDGLTLVGIRLYPRSGVGVGHEGTAFVQWEPQGGDGTTLKTNNFTLLLQDWAEITNPASVPAVVVTLTSALPASMAAGSWVEVIGVFDTTVSAVSVGGVAAASFNRIDGTHLHVKLPAGSAGSAPIVVTNVAGPSTALAYTRT